MWELIDELYHQMMQKEEGGVTDNQSTAGKPIKEQVEEDPMDVAIEAAKARLLIK